MNYRQELEEILDKSETRKKVFALGPAGTPFNANSDNEPGRAARSRMRDKLLILALGYQEGRNTSNEIDAEQDWYEFPGTLWELKLDEQIDDSTLEL